MMKKSKLAICALTLVLIFTMAVTAYADLRKLCLGADLTDAQKATVLAIMGLKETPDDVIYVTNKDERDLLGGFIPSEQIGTKSISSALVTLRDENTGITVTTHNISWCTSAMYVAALVTAGVQNADVIVAAPTQVSGTAALAGIYKAYELAANVTLSEEAKTVAGEELSLTGQLAEYLGTDEAVKLIAQIKQEIIAQGLDNEEAIRPAIEEAAKELKIQLTPSQVDMLVDLALKMVKLDMDPQQVAEQMQGIVKTLESLEKAQSAATTFFDKVSEGFTSVVNWFSGLFKK